MNLSRVIGRQDKQTLRRWMPVLVHTGTTREGYFLLHFLVLFLLWYEETSRFLLFFLSLLLYYSAFFLLSARLNALTITQGWKQKTEGSDLGRRRFLQARGDNVLSLDKEKQTSCLPRTHVTHRKLGESENREGGKTAIDVFEDTETPKKNTESDGRRKRRARHIRPSCF